MKAMMKAPKEHMRGMPDSSWKVYATQVALTSPLKGGSETMKGLMGEARDLRLHLDLFLQSKGNE